MKPATRVFWILVALNAVSAMAGAPYMRDFAEQGFGSRYLERMPLAITMLVSALGQVLIAVPAIGLGLALGPRLGLRTPLLTAIAGGGHAGPPGGRVVREATLWGLGAGVVLAGMSALPFLDLEQELVRRGLPVPVHPPAWAGVLASFAAGVGEETLLRFGLFTAVAWLASAVARGATPAEAEWTPPPFAFHVANVVAALVFGALHFVNVDAFGLPRTPAVVATVLVGNGIVGLVCGWLYWKRGLEAAMIAHVATDLVIHGLLPAIAPDVSL